MYYSLFKVQLLDFLQVLLVFFVKLLGSLILPRKRAGIEWQDFKMISQNDNKQIRLNTRSSVRLPTVGSMVISFDATISASTACSCTLLKT